MLSARLAALAAATLMVLAGPAAADSHYAPLDSPGPELQVPRDLLDASLSCTGDLAAASEPAVLLVHGTNLDFGSNFSWNYVPAMGSLGRGFCGVDLPEYGMNDIQIAAEYVVHAIRTVAARSGRPIQIIGFSQGGMIPRWALRWWPDTRPLVDDVVALAPSNHGTADATAACTVECYPSYWQQRLEAQFIAAVNSYTETFETIDYTNVYTHYDEVVQPNLDDSGSSSLEGGGNVTNVATQDVCPNNTAEHLALGTYDPVGYALAVDALGHAGPADTERVELEVCTKTFMPGVDEASFARDYAALLQTIAEANEATGRVTEEPPLQCYVTASCSRSAADRTDGGETDPTPAGGATEGRGAPTPATPSTGGGAATAGVVALLVSILGATWHRRSGTGPT